MMNKLRNSASPKMIWLLGVVVVPNACRKIASTIKMRVNDVMVMSAAGSSVSSDINKSICRLNE